MMPQRWISTRGAAPAVSFREALLAGLAPDGGLYVPARLDPLPREWWRELSAASAGDVGAALVGHIVGDEVPRATLERLLGEALDFPLPVVPVGSAACAVELFHGPTLAFKDVGARAMARLMAWAHEDGPALTVLVATSGDTGGAVAQAFSGVAGTRVVVLFPDGQVSPIQEAQFTTLGGNVTAVAVAGAFDDCQRLVKTAFADAELRRRVRLTSANSINVGRLLPQMVYYACAVGALGRDADRPIVVSVPSGNFGNLTAGLYARRLGLPIARFVAATNINDVVPIYLCTGTYTPRASRPTIANAMDVGSPSNFERILHLYGGDHEAIARDILGSVHGDEEVGQTVAEVWRRDRYLLDPHGAIGYRGVLDRAVPADAVRLFLATAHPAKFVEVVEPLIGEPVPIPGRLAACLARPRHVVRIGARPEPLVDILTGSA